MGCSAFFFASKVSSFGAAAACSTRKSRLIVYSASIIGRKLYGMKCCVGILSLCSRLLWACLPHNIQKACTFAHWKLFFVCGLVVLCSLLLCLFGFAHVLMNHNGHWQHVTLTMAWRVCIPLFCVWTATDSRHGMLKHPFIFIRRLPTLLISVCEPAWFLPGTGR